MEEEDQIKTCKACNTELPQDARMVADALWDAGMGVTDTDFTTYVCGNVDAMFNDCTRAVVENTLADRQAEKLKIAA